MIVIGSVLVFLEPVTLEYDRKTEGLYRRGFMRCRCRWRHLEYKDIFGFIRQAQLIDINGVCHGILEYLEIGRLLLPVDFTILIR